MTKPDSAAACPPTLVLASQSPRRALLLREAGYDPIIAASAFTDDPAPPQGREPLMLAVELATQKAQGVARDPAWHHPVILAADTISIGTGRQLLGQPQSRDEARTMIRNFLNTTHQVVTGVAIFSLESQAQEVLADVASVWLGEVSDETLEAYLATDAWRGKAGGYNLAHIRAQGWPVKVTGDETTVLGLPMGRLVKRLAAWGVHAKGAS